MEPDSPNAEAAAGIDKESKRTRDRMSVSENATIRPEQRNSIDSGVGESPGRRSYIVSLEDENACRLINLRIENELLKKQCYEKKLEYRRLKVNNFPRSPSSTISRPYPEESEVSGDPPATNFETSAHNFETSVRNNEETQL